MPTQEEKVAHVEAALRQRFFPFVRKAEYPNRVTWTEETHDVDRLSRSLAAYVVASIGGVSDARASGSLIDGPDDGGIDAVHFDRPKNQLLLVQSKFKRSGGGPSQADNLKTIRGVEALSARRFAGFNAVFQQRLEEIEEALDSPGVRIRLVIVFLGGQLSPHVTNDLDALKADLNSFAEQMGWSAWGLEHVYAALLAEQTPARVSVDVVLENWAGVTAPRRAIYGQISAASLADLVRVHETALFEKNIRHYLGSEGVNSAIERCVREAPREFFYLNNGITAVAEQIVPAVGTSARCGFRLNNVSIVNGAQTAGAISTAALDGRIAADAKLLITIVELGAAEDDLGVRITRARNHQNAVKGIDFAALDPAQERLRQELALLGITYHYRPSAEARVRREDACTLEEAAIALACTRYPALIAAEIALLRKRRAPVVNSIELAVVAKSALGRLWEQDGELYGRLFGESISGIRLYRCVLVHRFIDTILASNEQAEDDYARRMFYRHGRYFVTALVAHRSRSLVDAPRAALSPEDRTSLSRTIDTVAALAFDVTQEWRINKGYLAFFRSLTDAQQLAEVILARLKREDELAEAARREGAAPAGLEDGAPPP